MEKNSEPNKTFTHKVKRFLTKVVRSCNKEKTVSPKTVLGELDIHLPSNEAQFSSVTQSCPTLWDPVGCSMPGLPVHHQLPEFTQTHIQWVGHAIQQSHPLFIPSPPIFNLSQHQDLFKWGNSSHQVAKVLEFQLQHQSFHQRSEEHTSELQSHSGVWLFATTWASAGQNFLFITKSRSLLKLIPLSWWCHPTVSSSVDPFSSHLQPFPASGSFQIRQILTSSGQSNGVSASASVLPPNIQNGLPLGWTRWISLQSKGLSKFFLNTRVQKQQFSSAQLSL